MRRAMWGLAAIAILTLGLGAFAQQRAQNGQGAEPKSVVLLFPRGLPRPECPICCS